VTQGILPGLESYVVPSPAPYVWKPLPHVLEKVKSYFRGYQVKAREIFARRKYIAAKLEMGVRTLARYLAHLAAEGWLKTVKRTPRTAFREVLTVEPPVRVAGPSVGPCIEETSEVRMLSVNRSTQTSPESLRALRREIPSPLVIFRYVRTALKRKRAPKIDVEALLRYPE
jgi:hypothetical protein